jgi:K+-sensing histidine kinase KdpD
MESEMPDRETRAPSVSLAVIGQYSSGIAILFVLSSVCWALLPYTGHQFPALLFLLAVALAGTRWTRGAVLTMAVISAFVWNFLFIPPRFTLHIDQPQDAIIFALFFVIALGMGHLTTRLKAREEALERHQREREQLLSQRHRAELSAESERLHRTLLDSVSHELKTPIAVIRTALDGFEPGNPYAAEIETANRRLQRIVENLLEITRVESDAVKPQPEWCEVGDVIHSATAPLQRELSGRPLRLDGVETLPLLLLDGRLLAQALGIVLQNATTYSPAGSPLEIAAELDGSDLLLRVRDHGPGLAPGTEHRVFEKFYRAPGAPSGGTGLGLAIASGLMTALKGTILAENHPGGGAVFTLRLPVIRRTEPTS